MGYVPRQDNYDSISHGGATYRIPKRPSNGYQTPAPIRWNIDENAKLHLLCVAEHSRLYEINFLVSEPFADVFVGILREKTEAVEVETGHPCDDKCRVVAKFQNNFPTSLFPSDDPLHKSSRLEIDYRRMKAKDFGIECLPYKNVNHLFFNQSYLQGQTKSPDESYIPNTPVQQKSLLVDERVQTQVPAHAEHKEKIPDQWEETFKIRLMKLFFRSRYRKLLSKSTNEWTRYLNRVARRELKEFDNVLEKKSEKSVWTEDPFDMDD